MSLAGAARWILDFDLSTYTEILAAVLRYDTEHSTTGFIVVIVVTWKPIKISAARLKLLI